jgi:imidazolonepropionase-like amidohydrolase
MSVRTVFTGADVFDGTGAAPAPADVLIQDGRILDVGTGLDGDVEVDATGRTILPGFFDCHVHVVIDSIDMMRHLQQPFGYSYYVAAKNLAAILAVGITTIRDAAGADLAIKQALEDGIIPGPRMQIAIQMLSQTGGHADGWLPSGTCVHDIAAHPGMPSSVVDGPEEMRRRVRELVRAGADVIKVASSGGVMSPRDNPKHAHFRMDELETAVAEAAAAGIGVMAHAQATEGIKNAVQAGVRSVEHGIFLDQEAVDLMLKKGTYLVPTLMAPHSVLEAARAGAAITEASLEKVKLVVGQHAASFRLAAEAGVPIAMGTDAVGFPHGRNLEELELMAANGLAPLEVLKATTSNAARLLGVDGDRGTVETGKRADLVLLDGNPLEFTKLAERVAAVYQDGNLVAGGV